MIALIVPSGKKEYNPPHQRRTLKWLNALESTSKGIQIVRDINSQLTCLIRGPDHLSDEYKVLNDFGTKYDKDRHVKERRQDPTTKKSLEIGKR